MIGKNAIEVVNVSKKFSRSLKRSMLYGLYDIFRNSLGLSSKSHKIRKNEFWVVDDLSFSLKKGESIGIIGPNGSGKTTLLKMLNGIFWPDKGKVKITGRVGALIEVGAGFHPLLTGKENIYLNGSILGMSRKEIDEKFDKIVEFADIGNFLNTPVKHYSSGMFVRLGFSIAIHSEPDILLIDEILAVGDAGFRAKCYNKIGEIRDHTAIVFVTHNMSIIHRVVDRCIVINKSKIQFIGNTPEAVSIYQNLFEEKIKRNDGYGNRLIDVVGFSVNGVPDKCDLILERGDGLDLSLKLRSKIDTDDFLINLVFRNQEETIVAESNSRLSSENFKISKGGTAEVKITIPDINLNPGIYKVALLVMSREMLTHYYWNRNLIKMEVKGTCVGNSVYQMTSKWKFDKTMNKSSVKNSEIHDEEKNIFLVGHARGGSTVLAGIINWHSLVGPKNFNKSYYKNINEFLSDIFSPNFHIQYSAKLEQKDIWFSRFPGADVFTHMGNELIVEELDWKNEDIIQFRNRIKKEFHGTESVFLSKSPTNSFRVKILPKIFPNSKIIAIYRNGPEVIASWGSRSYGFEQRVNWGDFKRRKLKYKDGIDAFSKKWAETLEYLEEARKEMGFLAVRYDDLISNTSETLKFIFKYLGLPLEDYIYDVVLKDTRNKWKEKIPEKYHNYLIEKCEKGQKILKNISIADG